MINNLLDTIQAFLAFVALDEAIGFIDGADDAMTNYSRAMGRDYSDSVTELRDKVRRLMDELVHEDAMLAKTWEHYREGKDYADEQRFAFPSQVKYHVVIDHRGITTIS